MPDEALHGPRRGVAECADRVTLDAPRDTVQQVEVLAPPLAGEDAPDYPVHPPGPLAARRALAAGLGVVEAADALQHPHHAGRLVHDHDRAGAEHGAGPLDGL